MEKNANLYDGKPDGRQGGGDTKISRFRPKYRALSDAEKAHHDAIKTKAVELEALFEGVAPGRYRSMAMTDLESAVMWVVKELTGDGGLAHDAK